MKKIYLSILSIALIGAVVTAQSTENFDSYTAGVSIGSQATDIVPWGGTAGAADDALVSDTFSASPSNSLRLDLGRDVVWHLGDQLGGQWTVAFNCYLVADMSGFFGMLQAEDVSAPAFTTTMYMNNGGSGSDVIAQDNIIVAEGTWFNTDAWNSVLMHVDLDLDALIVWINDVEVFNGIYFGDGSFALGAANIWAPGDTPDAYFDDLFFAEGLVTLGSVDFEATGFRSALNNNILTLKANEEISNVSIYNMLGQEVYNSSVNTSSINIANFANGTYIVRVNINGTEGTVKIVK